MRTNFFVSVGIMLCFCLWACADRPQKDKERLLCAEWLMPDSVAYDKLGKRLATVLFSPQSVKCYRLAGKEKVAEKDVRVEGNFVRDAFLAKLSREEVAVLQYSLMKPAKSYAADSVVVMSPYMPVLEFEFVRKREKAHVLISLSDRTWTVLFDDKRQLTTTYANTELVSRFCNYYVSLYKSRKK